MGHESSRVCDLHVRDLVSNSVARFVPGLPDNSCSFYSSVAGATLFTTLTGFSWSIIQWAPFSLVGQCTVSNGQVLTIVQLAEVVGQELVREELIGHFVQLLKDNEAEVRTAAAGQVPGMNLATTSLRC